MAMYARSVSLVAYPMVVYARSISLLAYPTVVYASSDTGLAYPMVVYARSISPLVYPTAVYIHHWHTQLPCTQGSEPYVPKGCALLISSFLKIPNGCVHNALFHC